MKLLHCTYRNFQERQRLVYTRNFDNPQNDQTESERIKEDITGGESVPGNFEVVKGKVAKIIEDIKEIQNKVGNLGNGLKERFDTYLNEKFGIVDTQSSSADAQDMVNRYLETLDKDNIDVLRKLDQGLDRVMMRVNFRKKMAEALEGTSLKSEEKSKIGQQLERKLAAAEGNIDVGQEITQEQFKKRIEMLHEMVKYAQMVNALKSGTVANSIETSRTLPDFGVAYPQTAKNGFVFYKYWVSGDNNELHAIDNYGNIQVFNPNKLDAVPWEWKHHPPSVRSSEIPLEKINEHKPKVDELKKDDRQKLLNNFAYERAFIDAASRNFTGMPADELGKYTGLLWKQYNELAKERKGKESAYSASRPYVDTFDYSQGALKTAASTVTSPTVQRALNNPKDMTGTRPALQPSPAPRPQPRPNPDRPAPAAPEAEGNREVISQRIQENFRELVNFLTGIDVPDKLRTEFAEKREEIRARFDSQEQSQDPEDKLEALSQSIEDLEEWLERQKRESLDALADVRDHLEQQKEFIQAQSTELGLPNPAPTPRRRPAIQPDQLPPTPRPQPSPEPAPEASPKPQPQPEPQPERTISPEIQNGKNVLYDTWKNNTAWKEMLGRMGGKVDRFTIATMDEASGRFLVGNDGFATPLKIQGTNFVISPPEGGGLTVQFPANTDGAKKAMVYCASLNKIRSLIDTNLSRRGSQDVEVVINNGKIALKRSLNFRNVNRTIFEDIWETSNEDSTLKSSLKQMAVNYVENRNIYNDALPLTHDISKESVIQRGHNFYINVSDLSSDYLYTYSGDRTNWKPVNVSNDKLLIITWDDIGQTLNKGSEAIISIAVTPKDRTSHPPRLMDFRIPIEDPEKIDQMKGQLERLWDSEDYNDLGSFPVDNSGDIENVTYEAKDTSFVVKNDGYETAIVMKGDKYVLDGPLGSDVKMSFDNTEEGARNALRFSMVLNKVLFATLVAAGHTKMKHYQASEARQGHFFDVTESEVVEIETAGYGGGLEGELNIWEPESKDHSRVPEFIRLLNARIKPLIQE